MAERATRISITCHSYTIPILSNILISVLTGSPSEPWKPSIPIPMHPSKQDNNSLWNISPLDKDLLSCSFVAFGTYFAFSLFYIHKCWTWALTINKAFITSVLGQYLFASCKKFVKFLISCVLPIIMKDEKVMLSQYPKPMSGP